MPSLLITLLRSLWDNLRQRRREARAAKQRRACPRFAYWELRERAQDVQDE